MASVSVSASASGVVTKQSPRPVGDTVAKLLELLGSKGMTVFAVIDQQAAAQQVGLDLRATTLVLFGNPAGGTPVMDAAPLSALDLPLKVLVWDGGDQGCQVSYTDPAVLISRYGLSAEAVAPLAAIHGLTDALVTP
jgi:uncharacterized protein (DUF302 family)